MTERKRGEVTLVGAGLGGCMMALYLARQGYAVRMVERRPDMRRQKVSLASMNLGLSRRGLDALEQVGLAEEALRKSIPMRGRVIHRLNGELAYQPYGTERGEVIHAIQRGDINRILLAAAAAEEGVSIRFETRWVHLDRDRPALRLAKADGEAEWVEGGDFLIGADGASSAVRRSLQRGERANYSQEYLPWGWKEIRIPPDPDGGFYFEKHAFHLWPRGGSMLFAHPNRDASFTCSLVMPYAGELSFASLDSEEKVRAFFASTYPDLLAIIPDLTAQFLHNPIVDLVTVRTDPWYYRDKVVLLGDAAHAVVPFYAQGMNAAFGDCAELAACLARHPQDRERAFAEYQQRRKPHTDALAEMSKQNFLELRDTVRSPWVHSKKHLDIFLHRFLGEGWMPLHARVTHTLVPYADAARLCRRQDQALAGAGAGALGLLGLLLMRRYTSR